MLKLVVIRVRVVLLGLLTVVLSEGRLSADKLLNFTKIDVPEGQISRGNHIGFNLLADRLTPFQICVSTVPESVNDNSTAALVWTSEPSKIKKTDARIPGSEIRFFIKEQLLRGSIPLRGFPCGVDLKISAKELSIYSGGEECELRTISIPVSDDWSDVRPTECTFPDSITVDANGVATGTFTCLGKNNDIFTVPDFTIVDSSGNPLPTSCSISDSELRHWLDGKISYFQECAWEADLSWSDGGPYAVTIDMPSIDSLYPMTRFQTNFSNPAPGVIPGESTDTTDPTLGSVTALTRCLRLGANSGQSFTENASFLVKDVLDSESGIGEVTGRLVPQWDDPTEAQLPANGAVVPVPVEDAVPLSSASGPNDYRVTFAIPNPQTLHPPDRYVLELSVTDWAGNTTTVPDAAEIPVKQPPEGATAAPDLEAPEIENLRLHLAPFHWGPVNTEVSRQTVEATTVVSDSRSSGINRIRIEYRSPSGMQRGLMFTGTLTVGDLISGTFVNSFEIPQHAEPGTWTLQTIEVRDRAGNERFYSDGVGDPFPPGVQTSFEVVDPNGDSDRPRLTSFALSSTAIDVTSGDVPVTVTLDASDLGVGVEEVRVEFGGPRGQLGPLVTLTAAERISGDAAAGRYVGTATFLQGQAGSFIARVTVKDAVGNTRAYGATVTRLGPADLPMLANSPEAVKADVTNPTPPNAPPVVTTWSFPSLAGNTLPLVGADLNLAMQILAGDPDDDIHPGARRVTASQVIFTSPTGRQVKHEFYQSDRTQGDSQNGTFEFNVPFHRNAEPGLWTIRVELLDTFFNRPAFGIVEGNLPAGAPATLMVTNTISPVDLEDPIPVEMRFSPVVIPANEAATLSAKVRFIDDVSGFQSATWTASRPNGVHNFTQFASGTFFDGAQTSGDAMDGCFEVDIPVTALNAQPGFIIFATGPEDKSGGNNLNHTLFDGGYSSRSWDAFFDFGDRLFPYDSGRVLVVEDPDYATWAQTAFPANTPAEKRHPAVDLDDDGKTNDEERLDQTDPAVSDLQPSQTQTWREANFTPEQLADPLVSGLEADANGNGENNLWHFSQNRGPFEREGDGEDPLVTERRTDGDLIVSYRRRTGGVEVSLVEYEVDGIVYFVELATELTGASPWGTYPNEVTKVGSAVDNGDGTETITLRFSVPGIGASERAFVRVRVVELL